MSDTGPMPRRATLHFRTLWWWSRRDEFANSQLVDIFARHGHPCLDITSPDAVDASLRVAVQNEAALDELAEWVAMISARRGVGRDSRSRLRSDDGH